jgi:rubrerythrin
MSNAETVANLFEMAIAAEGIAEQLYRGLAPKFAHHPDVADFWSRYAAEEAGHARWLEHLWGTVDPQQLASVADRSIVEQAHKLLQFSPENALKQMGTLEDAYQLVNELENSELNVIFEFLITSFSSDKTAQAIVRTQLREHIARLITDFPAQFRHPASRQAVDALE